MDPPDRARTNLGSGSPHGGTDRSTHATGQPEKDDRWLRSVVHNSSEIVTMVGPDGTLRYANPAWQRVLGYDPKEEIGKMNVLEYVHPEDLPHVLEETEKALSEGGIATNEAEYRFRHKDGSWRWIESVGTYLLEDPALGGVVVTSRDVTERKEAEEALKENETFARQVLRSLPNGSVNVFDRDLRYLFAKGRGLEEVGMSLETLVGRTIQEVFGEEGLGLVEGHYRKAFSGEEVRFELPMGGLAYEINAALLHTHEDGEVRTILAVARNVTERKRAEEKLREAEERYRTLVEAVPAMTYIQEIEEGASATIYVSPQVEEIVGYTPEECTSAPDLWAKILHPEDRERVLAEDRRTNETGEPFAMEYRQFARDGSVVWLRDEATLVRDENGKPLYWLGVQVDITERRRAEEAHREAEERYRTLVEQIPAVTYIDRATDGPDEPIYTSPQIEDLLGYTPEEWLEGRLWPERIHPEDKECILAADERFEAGGEPFSEEYRLVARDESVVWVREDAVLVRDEKGEPLYFQGVLLDITKRKEAEAALRESEARLHVLADSAFEGILITDEGVILEVNRALTDMFDYEASDVLGRSTMEFVAPEYRDLVQKKIASGSEEPYEAWG